MLAKCRNMGGGDYIFEVTEYTGSSFQSADKTLLHAFEEWKKANPMIAVKNILTLPSDAILAVTEKRVPPTRK